MRKTAFVFWWLTLLVLLPWSCIAADPTPASPPRLIMDDGQLISRPVSVFISAEVSARQEPRLRLLGKTIPGGPKAESDALFQPYDVVENQRWEGTVDGQRAAYSGTLLFFDLNRYAPLDKRPMRRVIPVLQWKKGPDSPGWENRLIGKEISLGNGPMVVVYTLGIVVAVVGSIILISKAARGQAVYLLTGADGYLSLSRTQMALWTVAIGGVVFGYGLFQSQVPQIPESLVALMGLSLATTGISYVRVKKSGGAPDRPPLAAPQGPVSDSQAAPPPPAAPEAPARPRLGDLVTVSSTSTAAKDLSIAKAQMLFWTGLILVLFLAKSIQEGSLWEVPWEMVALMGMSQAGYLGPKFVQNP